jgi:hypothetical protein
MKYILLLIILFVINSCDSTNDEPDGAILQFGIAPTVSLVGGSRWFSGGDTGIYYDASVDFLLRNGTSNDRKVYYVITFGLKSEDGLITDSSFIVSLGGLTFVSDTLDLRKNGSISISDTLFVGLGRTIYQDWHMPYAYKLTVYSVNTSDTLMTEGSCAGSIESNRFHGATLTDSKGVVLGLADGPDDGDYNSPDTAEIKVLPFYPNPATHTAIGIYTTLKKRKAFMSYFYTPRISVGEAGTTDFFSGTNNFYADLRELPNGQFRIGIIFIDESGKQDTIYGDILK